MRRKKEKKRKKRKERKMRPLIHAIKWMNLKTVRLGERSLT